MNRLSGPGGKGGRLKPVRLKYTLLALPFIVYIIAFKYVPLAGWVLAFTNYKPGKSLANTEWIGLQNFKLITGLYSKDVLNALMNTLVLSLLSFITLILPMVFAILLNEVRRTSLRKFIQTTVTIPHFVGWVIVFSLCFQLFSANGMVNTIFYEKLGWLKEPQQLLGNADTIYPFMVTLDIWKGLGWNAIVYLAAIAGIDSELYDAAHVDGAGRFRSIWHITIPGLMPTFIVLLFLHIGGFLNLGLEKYLLFTNSIVARKLDVLEMFTYRVGINTQDYTFATAVTILKSMVSLVLITGANVFAKRVRGEGII